MNPVIHYYSHSNTAGWMDVRISIGVCMALRITTSEHLYTQAETHKQKQQRTKKKKYIPFAA